MTSYLDKLNLRPQERRIVVFVAVVVFVVVNVIWVVPQFGQVDFWNNKRNTAENKLQEYNREIGRVRTYNTELAALQSEGITIGTEDPTLSLQREVSSLASASGVLIELNSPVQRTSRTNSLFEEAGMRITITSLESNLVEFLYNLGARGTLIRVRTMSLQPDPSQTRLKGTLEFVQSFLKKTVKPGTPLATAAKAAAKAPGAPTKATTPAAVGTNAGPAKPIPATKAPASTNWFKKLLSRITGGSSTPKPAATNAVTKKPATGGTKFTPNTNKPPANPAPSAPQ